MRNSVLFTVLVMIASCGSKDREGVELGGRDKTAPNTPQKSMLALLDSLNACYVNPKSDTEKLIDSVLYEQIDLNRNLSSVDFDLLKKGIKEGYLENKSAKQLFAKELTTRNLEQNTKIPIKFYSFEADQEIFNYFAVAIQGEGSNYDAYEVFFFHADKLIGKHVIQKKYGLKLNHFTNEKKELIIYYPVNFINGTGVFWNQNNFYKVKSDSLIPVLSLIENSTSYSLHGHDLATEFVSTSPLKIRYNYRHYFLGENEKEIDFLKGSEVIQYTMNRVGKYVADYQGKILKDNKLSTFYVSLNELLFLKTFYPELKKEILGENVKLKNAIYDYLVNFQ